MTAEKIYAVAPETPTKFDRLLARTLLRIFPAGVTPNQITTFRYLSIPAILYLLLTENNGWGLGLFIIAAFSDAVDGSLARTRRKITTWGKLHDPLADKLLIGSVGALIVTLQAGLFYLIAAIIVVELFLVLNAFLRIKKGVRTVAALWPGKIKMILQSAGVGLILLAMTIPAPAAPFIALATYILYLSLFFALVSLVVYNL